MDSSPTKPSASPLDPVRDARHGHGHGHTVSQLRVDQAQRLRSVDEWSRRCEHEESDARAEAMRFEKQLTAALQSTAHMGVPNAFRTAICFDVLSQISAKFARFDVVMGILQKETARAVYLTPPSLVEPLPATDTDAQSQDSDAVKAARIHRFFAQRTYFTQLKQVLAEKDALEARLNSLDAMHALMTKQLRNEEQMVDKIAKRWGRVLLKQTLVDWKKIIVRKKYTRVLLEKTSGRWSKQRHLRVFRHWADFAKAQRVIKVKEKLQQCQESTRDFEELIVKMEAQIESAKLESKGHREHYDFAKRQILSLDELLNQLDLRVQSSNERKLQAIVNEWGRMCLAFVDCQVDYLQHMVDSVCIQQYADATALLMKGEELSELISLPSDVLVLRWINYQLSMCSTFKFYQTSTAGFIQNFSSDMNCNFVLRHILNRVIMQKQDSARYSSCGVAMKRMSAFLSLADGSDGGAATKAPFATREELRAALEEKLNPPCPTFLSVQVLENDTPSDLVFSLFSFIACEHPTLVPLPPAGECPWKEAQIALDDARAVWATIRGQWTELQTPFEIREVMKATPDLTSPPHLLVRANIALQNAVNTVQYACSKRSIVMKTWGCLQRKIQQDAMRLLLRRGRHEEPIEMMDRRLWREKYMLTTLHISKLAQAFATEDDSQGKRQTVEELEADLVEIESTLEEQYEDLRRVYRYYASIDTELQRTDILLRHRAGGPTHREAQDEERFFHKISISMSLVEFHVFLKDCRVFGTAKPFPYEFIRRIFEQVNTEVAAGSDAATILTTRNLTAHSVDDGLHDNNASEMTPAEFVEALVHVARSKHLRLKHPATAMTMPLSLPQRFRRMLLDVVIPNAMQEKERVNVFHEQLMSAECRDVFTKHQRNLHGVYVYFAGLELRHEPSHAKDQTGSKLPSKQPKQSRRMLSVNGLVAILKQFELLKENYLNLDDVQHILSEVLQLERDGIHFNLDAVAACLAHHEASVAESSSGAMAKSDQTEDELFVTYAEFLEIAAAVACYLRPDAFVPLADKLDDFFSEELQLTTPST